MSKYNTMPFDSWVHNQLKTRLAYLPDEQSDALRLFCEYVLRPRQYTYEPFHQDILRIADEGMAAKGVISEQLNEQVYQCYKNEYKERQRDALFFELERKITAVLKHAQPYYIIHSNRDFREVTDGDFKFWEESGHFIERYDQWSEWALLKLQHTGQQYLNAHYPVLYANRTFPTLRSMADEARFQADQNEGRLLQEDGLRAIKDKLNGRAHLL